MKKIGILGGTFNPIHNGHLALGEAAYNQLAFDQVIYISSGVSYLKKGIIMPSKEHRYNMTCLACDNYPYFISSDIEIKKEGNSYTCETLVDLKEDMPDSEFYYIIGADTLFSIENWKNPEVIFSLSTIVVAVRDNLNTSDLLYKKEELERKYNSKIIILEFNKVDISSTLVREKLKNNENVTDLLPENVLSYIINNSLYTS